MNLKMGNLQKGRNFNWKLAGQGQNDRLTGRTTSTKIVIFHGEGDFLTQNGQNFSAPPTPPSLPPPISGNPLLFMPSTLVENPGPILTSSTLSIISASPNRRSADNLSARFLKHSSFYQLFKLTCTTLHPIPSTRDRALPCSPLQSSALRRDCSFSSSLDAVFPSFVTSPSSTDHFPKTLWSIPSLFPCSMFVWQVYHPRHTNFL